MKRALALFIAAMIVSLSFINSYKITAEASVIPSTPGLAYSTFSTLFGNFWGFMESTDSMTTNHVKDNITYFVNDLITPDYVTWGDIALEPGISSRKAFCNLLFTAKMAYDASVQTYGYNPLLYALDKKSYSATGTLFSKGAAASVDEAIAKYEAMSDSEFEGVLNDLNKALSDDEYATSMVSVGKIRSLFDDMMIATIGISNYESNEWIASVTDTVYDFNELGVAMVSVNGVDFRIARITDFNGKRNAGGAYWRYVFQEPVICVAIHAFSEANSANLIFPYFISENKTFYTAYKDGKKNNTSYIDTANLHNVLYSISISSVVDGTSSFVSNIGQTVISTDRDIYAKAIAEHIYDNMLKQNAYLDDAESITDTSPEYAEALDTLDNKQLTLKDLMDLATNIAAIQSTAGTDTAVDDLTDTINGIAVTLPDAIVDGKNDVVQAVEGLGEAILTLPKAIWLEFEATLEAIRTKAEARPWEDGESNQNSNDILLIFNGLLLLLYIIIILLRIFVHCLQLVISIFAVPPSSALLPEEMVMGLEHLNTIQIPVIGLSVYSFMMGLVYILIVFYAIRILRINIDRIKVPKHTSGGL